MTRNEILDIAHEFYTNGGVCERDIAFARFVMGKEREACAKVCDEVSMQAYTSWKLAYQPEDQGREMGANDCAAAIRARGQQ